MPSVILLDQSVAQHFMNYYSDPVLLFHGEIHHISLHVFWHVSSIDRGHTQYCLDAWPMSFAMDTSPMPNFPGVSNVQSMVSCPRITFLFQPIYGHVLTGAGGRCGSHFEAETKLHQQYPPTSSAKWLVLMNIRVTCWAATLVGMTWIVFEWFV